MRLRNLVFLSFFLLTNFSYSLDHFPFSDDHSDFSLPYYVNARNELLVVNNVVQAGDQIFFETGESVIFKKVLGEGRNTIIFEDSLGRAVRMNTDFQNTNRVIMFEGYRKSMSVINLTLDESRSVRVLQEQPKSQHILFVEMIEIELNAEEFLRAPDRRSAKYHSLLDFINSFRVFSVLGEFAPFQIGWVEKRGWVLFDIGEDAIVAESEQFQSITEELLHEWRGVLPGYIIEDLERDLHAKFMQSQFRAPLSCNNIL